MVLNNVNNDRSDILAYAIQYFSIKWGILLVCSSSLEMFHTIPIGFPHALYLICRFTRNWGII